MLRIFQFPTILLFSFSLNQLSWPALCTWYSDSPGKSRKEKNFNAEDLFINNNLRTKYNSLKLTYVVRHFTRHKPYMLWVNGILSQSYCMAVNITTVSLYLKRAIWIETREKILNRGFLKTSPKEIQRIKILL